MSAEDWALLAVAWIPYLFVAFCGLCALIEKLRPRIDRGPTSHPGTSWNISVHPGAANPQRVEGAGCITPACDDEWACKRDTGTQGSSPQVDGGDAAGQTAVRPRGEGF